MTVSRSASSNVGNLMNARPRFAPRRLRHRRCDFRGRTTNKSTFIREFKNNNYFHHSSMFVQSSGNKLILKSNYSPVFPQVVSVLIEKLACCFDASPPRPSLSLCGSKILSRAVRLTLPRQIHQQRYLPNTEAFTELFNKSFCFFF